MKLIFLLSYRLIFMSCCWVFVFIGPIRYEQSGCTMHKAEALTETREGRPRVTQVEKNVRRRGPTLVRLLGGPRLPERAHALQVFFTTSTGRAN